MMRRRRRLGKGPKRLVKVEKRGVNHFGGDPTANNVLRRVFFPWR